MKNFINVARGLFTLKFEKKNNTRRYKLKFSYCLHLACLLAKNHSLEGLISMDKSHVFILCSLYQFFHFFIEIGKPGNTSMINCGYNCWYWLYRKLSLELTFLISFTAINSPEIFDSVKHYGYSPGFDLYF